MAAHTRTGSCHCGRIRFEVDLDADAPTGKCNCSICSKLRHWDAAVKPDAFRLLSDEADLTDYRFGAHHVHWPFCRICGTHVFSRGEIPGFGAFVSVSVACLDDLTPEHKAALPVRFANGRDDDWGHPPAVTGHL